MNTAGTRRQLGHLLLLCERLGPVEFEATNTVLQQPV
jgi:hypothetical protein